jgi:hypothetical protein
MTTSKYTLKNVRMQLFVAFLAWWLKGDARRLFDKAKD